MSAEDSMDNLQNIKEYAKKNSVPIMFDETSDFICRYIAEHEVHSILEIGSAIGYSAIRFASIKPDVKVTTIEIDIDRAIKAIENIKNANMNDRIKLINMDALAVDLEETFDLIFIDAAKAQYTRFFEKFKKNLSENGAIISDNLSFHGMVEDHSLTHNYSTIKLVRKIKRYVDFLKFNTEFTTTFFECGDGISVSRKNEPIDFSRLEKISQGNTAEIFGYGEDKIIKLYKKDFPKEAVINEFSNTLKINRLGLPSPKAFRIFFQDDRFGAIYEKIEGTPVARISDENKKIEALRKSIDLQKEFHGIESKDFMDYKEFLLTQIKDRNNPENFETIRKIKHLPQGTELCHGDFHPENLILKSDGSICAIDFMNTVSGPAEFDIAWTYRILLEHASKKHAEEYLKAMDVGLEEIEPFIEVLMTL